MLVNYTPWHTRTRKQYNLLQFIENFFDEISLQLSIMQNTRKTNEIKVFIFFSLTKVLFEGFIMEIYFVTIF